MSKKVSYKNLLKQAISEYDTSKTVQVKGPMLDPILSWDGDGELPVYKDAASILERYYFNENAEEPVMVQGFEEDSDLHEAENMPSDSDKINVGERESNQDGKEPKTPSEKHGEGPGTQQAGTSNASNIRGDLKNQGEDIAKEDVDYDEDDTLFAEDTLADDIELFFSEQNEEAEEDDAGLDVDEKMAQKDGEEGAEKDDDDDDEDDEGGDNGKDGKDKEEIEVDESAAYTEEAENAVIEKLIDEMEDLDEMPMTYSKEGPKESGKKQMSYSKEGPAPGMEAPDEKASKDSEQHTYGSGTDQAGTGPGESQIPPRKDQHDEVVKPKKYSDEPTGNKVAIGDSVDLFDADLDLELIEALGVEEDAESIEEKEYSGKEVPPKHKYTNEPEKTKMGESSAVPGGPSPRKSQDGEDWEEGRYYEESAMRESFELFKEAIKEDDESDKKDDDDNIIV